MTQGAWQVFQRVLWNLPFCNTHTHTLLQSELWFGRSYRGI
jgi:hypothetical protein